MLKKMAILLCGFMLFACSLAACAADVLDRIVATVNGHVILQSDWEDEICYEAFINGRSLSSLTPATRKASLDRLIDQELLREQIRGVDSPHDDLEGVGKRVLEIREHYPGTQSEQEWHTLLERYGMTQDGLESRIRAELDLTRLVDARLRPTVTVDAKSIESYYNQELLPQLRQTGAADVLLAEVTPKIKEVLTQEKMNQLLTAWLKDLRAGSEIHMAGFSPASGGQAQ
jgi:peptidyl-prolyl cis-trans isomerase SurA